MSSNTINMALTAPSSLQDVYSYTTKARNLYLIDSHDHSPGRGVRLTGASIVPGSLAGLHLAPNSVGTSQLNAAGIMIGINSLSTTPADISATNLQVGSITFSTPSIATGGDPLASTTSVIISVRGGNITNSIAPGTAVPTVGFAVSPNTSFSPSVSAVSITPQVTTTVNPSEVIDGRTDIRVSGLSLDTTYTYYVGISSSSTPTAGTLMWEGSSPGGFIAAYTSL